MLLMGRRTAANIALQYVTTVTSEDNLATYTFSGVPLGTAAADRQIVIAVSWRKTPALTVTATIAGVSATLDKLQDGADGVAILRAAVPTGTTGDIVVTLGAQQYMCWVSVYRLTGASTGAPATAGTNTNGATMTATSGSVAVAAAGAYPAASFSWSGVTKNFDAHMELALIRFTSASGAGATATCTAADGPPTAFSAALAAYTAA